MVLFHQIMTRGIIFYDDEYAEECQEFCLLRNISYLPHIIDKHTCYYFDKKKKLFTKKPIQADQIVEAEESIFQRKFAEIFEEFDVLFVQDKEVLCGVVHFSDYNRPAVHDHLYQQLYLLERALVFLVVKYGGKTKRQLFEFFNKAEDERTDELLTEKDFRGHKISLKHILEFVAHYDLLKMKKEDIKRVIEIRNAIAHSDDLVTQTNQHAKSYHHNSFVKLLRGVDSMEVALRQLSNRLYLLRAIEEDDFTMPPMPLEDYLFK
ncbi:MAG: hypothetical protein AAFR61_01105 [Bacteroidota bacterium]